MAFFRSILDGLGFARPPSREAPAVPSEPPVIDRRGQILGCSARFDPGAPRHATLASLHAATDVGGFIPAALLAQKAKSVADGVVAALEGLSTAGGAEGTGWDAFLEALASRMPPGSPAWRRVRTACEIASGAPASGADAARFLADPVRSKPLGLYTWGEDLGRMFRRDRFLQAQIDDEEADVLRTALLADPSLLATYVRHLRRVQRLTNPFARPSVASERNRFASRAILPPSAAPENDATSIRTFFDDVQRGALSLDPSPEDGFYAHQLRTLDPLLRPGSFPEARVRVVDADYAAALEHLAAMNLFAARETHVKQLDVLETMGALRGAEVSIRPDVKLEPLPTYYAYLGDAFRFLRAVVEEGWGEPALAAPQRRPSGPVAATLADGVDEVIALAGAAAELSRRELAGAVPDAEVDTLRARLSALWSDPDATGDLRGMVPLGFTGDNAAMLRVLVMAGWQEQRIVIRLESIPDPPPGSRLGAVSYPLPFPVVREMVIPAGAVQSPSEVRATLDAALAASDRAPTEPGPHPVPRLGG